MAAPIRFFFDFSSTFSYIAVQKMMAVNGIRMQIQASSRRVRADGGAAKASGHRSALPKYRRV